MEHHFELPVAYGGEVHHFNGRLVTFGYSYRLYIIVKGKELVFERDEDQDYRVLDEGDSIKIIADRGLLEAIVASLKKLT